MAERAAAVTGEREGGGLPVCVRVNQEESTAGVAAGKFTVAALRFYRIMSLTFIFYFLIVIIVSRAFWLERA